MAGATAEEIRATGSVNIGELKNKLPLIPNYSLRNSTRPVPPASA